MSAGIGIESGLILTSGDATLAPGPNSGDGTGSTSGTGGDTDLGGLIPGFSTFDANILEFDFTTSTGDLFFDYVFASEEYNEFVFDSFNDVFGFFVDGTNVALIPGTSDPVSIDNVNCGNPFSPPSGGSNCDLYNNNDLDDGGPFFDIEYDGFTDVFTASVLGLSAGTHRIKLAIADAGDTNLDSAIFIKTGSFTGTNPGTSVPEPTAFALFGVGLVALGTLRRRKA